MIDLPILDDSAGSQPQAGDAPKQRFWRSPAHLHKDPDFVQQTQGEFAPGAMDAPSGASRRQFLQLMGASMAMAGLTACRRPVEKILPYSRKPEDLIPGIPLYYATAMPFRGAVRPILVESHEGRPTKVEGNPEHPYSNGGTSVFEQASVLNLYDPDRSRLVLRDGDEASWQDFVDFSRDFGLSGGQRVVVLAESTSSPTLMALRDQMQQRFASFEWITYHAGGDDPVGLGMQQAFGRPLRPHYQFDEADVVVSFDADFTGSTDPDGTQNLSGFAKGRRLDGPDDTMNRLYVIESAYTVTGAMADHRRRLRASDIPHFAAAVAARLGVGAGGAQFADDPYVLAIADDLRQAGSRAVVLAGETQPPEVHALCAALNSALASQVVRYFDTGAETVRPQAEVLADLVRSLNAGQVDALIMLGVNPVYDAPAIYNFSEAMTRAGETIHIGQHVNETARASRWHLPRAHYLESWGDGRAYDGTLSVIQPLIAPLYPAAHSDAEIMGVLATGEDRAGYDIVRETWRNQITGSFEEGWRRVLHDGYLPGTGFTPVTAGAAAAPNMRSLPVAGADDLEVVWRLDPTVLDGSFTNNAWCMELPDPMTKIVWDNVAIMSPATARLLGVQAEYDTGNYSCSVVEIAVGELAVVIPAWIMPGHPDGSVSVTLGYGRSIASLRPERDAPFWDSDSYTDVYGEGALANDVGVNVGPLRPTASTAVVVGAAVRPTGELYEIVTTQDHGALDPEARPLFRMGTLDTFRTDPNFVEAMNEYSPGEPFEEYPMLWESKPGGSDHPQGTPAYKDNPYFKNQWGMAIDLNACNGCNACIVACNSENNIQVVGKQQVGKGRELHWLRLDRYFITSHDDLVDHTSHEDAGEFIPSDPQVVLQPMMCQHCENAPCESVCPVAATVHSPDGTNQMIYNRCIGTRYCSNNCPYKVRRYNWYNWTKTLPLEVQMAQNPNVTVRFRGVMEKCSWCVQRIRETQQRAGLEEREVRDGELQTACQEACPSDAIIFGDLNDPGSEVNRWKANPRNYNMLAYLNVKPRLSYLGRVTNPNPALQPVT